MALLEVSVLTVLRDGWPLVDGVSFSVEEEELVAVAGPRGAGKSTLLACLAGLVPATSGDVSFDGRPVTRDDAARRVRLGIAWVRAGGASATTCGQVRWRAWSKGSPGPSPGATAVDVPGAIGFALARRRRPVASLSRKDRVVAALERAMGSGARLLMVDAPTAGMSGPDAAVITSTLRDLTRRGLTVVLAEHAGPAVLGADRVVVLDHGRIVSEGAGREQYERLMASYLGAGA